ncbi:MAG: GAF domain-containing sensor histidine kinase, partial [Chloroflexi bacterium]|nr:GAF domain-containing sensor histidine kinase [Chloroflexota bacterium]
HEDVDSLRLPVETTPNLAHIRRTGQPLLVPDIQAEPGWSSVVSDKQAHVYLGVPIQLHQQVIGCLNVFNRTPGAVYTDDQTQRLQAFAGQAATAIKNAQLHHQVQTVAVLQERQRLARDLHDAVSQTLFSASMIAEALPQLVEHNPAALAPQLDNILTLTRGAMAEMRALLMELRPETLERYTLSELLHQLAEALQARKQIAVHLQPDDPPVLPANIKEAIYRITQEVLNNIIKHSQASEVSIRVHSSLQQFRLTVRDNGQGFDPQQRTTGIGLYSMRERARTNGLTLVVDSAPGQGTSITMIWPHSA